MLLNEIKLFANKCFLSGGAIQTNRIENLYCSIALKSGNKPI